jgi:bacterioferritin (cytochrome b1)
MQTGMDENALETLVEGETLLEDVSASTESFVKQSFAAVLHLHEEILAAKEEQIKALKEENAFLKESLYAVQNVYDEDKTTIKLLSEQLKQTQEELEFVKRKYKMMWNQAVENYGKQK